MKRDRVFPSDVVAQSAGPVSSRPEGNKPLSGWKIAIIGNTAKPKAELTKALMDLGATVVTNIDKKVAACISNKGKKFFSGQLLWFLKNMCSIRV